MEKRSSQFNGANNSLVLHVRLGFGSLSNIAPVTSGELIRCSKRIALASELGSCQSNLCHSCF